MQRVFIVEDEMILNYHLSQFLESKGYSTAMASSGEKCLEMLASGDIPDLILMDINLGDGKMNGPTTTQKIYEQYDIPVVLHSAYTDKATIDTTREMTKYGYIQKVPGNEEFITATIEMAMKLHKSERELKQRENMYRDLSNHLQKVREEQNAYLAREIHDDLGQSLTALKMNLSIVKKIIENDTEHDNSREKIKKLAEDMDSILNGTVKRVRRISTELRPSVLDTSGIVEAIEWQIDEFKQYFDIEVGFHCSSPELELDTHKALMLFRIIQEALTNSVRHGDSSRVDIEMNTSNGNVECAVIDNGHGFDPQATPQEASFGLLGMHERAAHCGGRLHIDSEPGRGTRVHVCIPYNEVPSKENEA
ncbi:MAG: response regulator [Spirochaetota bacterium]